VNNATNHRSMYSHKHINIWTNIAETMLQKNRNQFLMKTFCMYSITVHLFTLVPLNRWNIFFKSVFKTALVRIFFCHRILQGCALLLCKYMNKLYQLKKKKF
jgi:hypothetical protein